MINIQNVLSFAFELQLYKKIRVSQGEHKKRSYFRGYSKTTKISAVNNLISILEGNKITSLSGQDKNALRNGALGRLCSRYADLFGFRSRTKMFESKSLIHFCNFYVDQSLKFDDKDLHNDFDMKYVRDEISRAYVNKEKAKNDFANLPLSKRIDGTIDIKYDFCKNQLNDSIFMNTSFRKWKLVEKDDHFLKFMVGSQVFYCSNRVAYGGEMRGDNLLSYMENNPISCMNDLADNPTDLINYVLCSQINTVNMFLDGEISQTTLKNILGKIHRMT